MARTVQASIEGDPMTEILVCQLESSVKPSQNRRVEPRVNQRIPVEVCGFNRHGRYFSEKTFTVEVSDGGCRLRLRTEVEAQSIVAVRLILRRMGREIETRPSLFQVNWLQVQPNGWTLGVSKLQTGTMLLTDVPAAE
jgi:hypothetical protein